MGKSTRLKIDRYCSLVMQGFSNFLGLFQVIMANPVPVFNPENLNLLGLSLGVGYEVARSQVLDPANHSGFWQWLKWMKMHPY